VPRSLLARRENLIDLLHQVSELLLNLRLDRAPDPLELSLALPENPADLSALGGGQVQAAVHQAREGPKPHLRMLDHLLHVSVNDDQRQSRAADEAGPKEQEIE